MLVMVVFRILRRGNVLRLETVSALAGVGLQSSESISWMSDDDYASRECGCSVPSWHISNGGCASVLQQRHSPRYWAGSGNTTHRSPVVHARDLFVRPGAHEGAKSGFALRHGYSDTF